MHQSGYYYHKDPGKFDYDKIDELRFLINLSHVGIGATEYTSRVPYDYYAMNFNYLRYMSTLTYDNREIEDWDIPNVGYDRFLKSKLRTLGVPEKGKAYPSHALIGFRPIALQTVTFGIFCGRWIYFEYDARGIRLSDEEESSIKEYDRHNVLRLVDGRSKKCEQIKYYSFSKMNFLRVEGDVEVLINRRRYLFKSTYELILSCRNCVFFANDGEPCFERKCCDGNYKVDARTGEIIERIEDGGLVSSYDEYLSIAKFAVIDDLIETCCLKMSYVMTDLNIYNRDYYKFIDLDSTKNLFLPDIYEIYVGDRDLMHASSWERVRHYRKKKNIFSFDKKESHEDLQLVTDQTLRTDREVENFKYECVTEPVNDDFQKTGDLEIDEEELYVIKELNSIILQSRFKEENTNKAKFKNDCLIIQSQRDYRPWHVDVKNRWCPHCLQYFDIIGGKTMLKDPDKIVVEGTRNFDDVD